MNFIKPRKVAVFLIEVLIIFYLDALWWIFVTGDVFDVPLIDIFELNLIQSDDRNSVFIWTNFDSFWHWSGGSKA